MIVSALLFLRSEAPTEIEEAVPARKEAAKTPQIIQQAREDSSQAGSNSDQAQSNPFARIFRGSSEGSQSNTSFKVAMEIKPLVEALRKGDQEQFEQGMLELEAQHPNDFRPSAGLAEFYYDQGDLVRAEEKLISTIMKKPDHYKARNTLGDVQASQGKFEAAAESYKASLDHSGGNLYAGQSYLAAATAAGQRAEAINHIKIKYNNDPTRPTLRMLRADVALLEGDTDTYEKINEQLRSENSDHPLVNQNKVVEAFIEGDIEEVLRSGAIATRDDPDKNRQRATLRLMLQAAQQKGDERLIAQITEQIKATF